MRSVEDQQIKVTAAAVAPRPVRVAISENRSPAASLTRFTFSMVFVGRSRQRTGAMEWRLYRDVGVVDRYVEAFVVRSWAELMFGFARALNLGMGLFF